MREASTGDQLPLRIDESLLRNEEIVNLFERAVEKANQNFDTFEQVKRFRLIGEALTMEGEELTPTLKVKKSVIKEKYKDLLQEIYSE